MDIQAPVNANQPANAPQNAPGVNVEGPGFDTNVSNQAKSTDKNVTQEKYYDIDGERVSEKQLQAEYKRQKEHRRAANEAFQKAKAESTKVERLREAASNGDSKEIRKILREFGANDMKFAQDVIAEEYENYTMSDEQKQMLRRQQELEEKEAKIKEFEKNEQQTKAQQQQTQILNVITNEAVSAFEQLGHKPDPLTLSLFATQLKSGFEDVQNLTRADIYDAAKNVFQSELRVTSKNLMGVKEASQLRQRLGDQTYRHLKQIFEQEVTSRSPYQNQNNIKRSSGNRPMPQQNKPITSQKEFLQKLGLSR